MAKANRPHSRRRLPAPILSLAGLAIVAVAGCAVPPDQAYVTLGARQVAETRPAGVDATGATCISQASRAPALELPVAAARDVFCGGGVLPAARVFALRGPSGPADLDQIASGGIWRRWLDQRLTCEAPQPIRLSDGTEARLLPCRRLQSSLMHLAIVTRGSDGPVVADGYGATLPVVERIARGADQGAGQAGTQAAALNLAVQQALARAYGPAAASGADDARFYDEAMRLGQEQNLAENYAEAERAYRAAVVIQQRGNPNNPDAINPVVLQAFNISNQQRFSEAEALFQRAETLVASSSDRTARARLQHYRGLHALNLRQDAQALELLAEAEAGYLDFVPPDLLTARTETQNIAIDPSLPVNAQTGVIGLIEVRRARATLLARGGREDAAAAALASSRDLQRRVGYSRATVTGRALRTEAALLSAQRVPQQAASILDRAAESFGQAAPGQQRSEARTLFLAGQRWLEAGQLDAALSSYRAGTEILRSRRIFLGSQQVLGYLDALAAAAAHDPAAAPSLQVEMFAAAQFAQAGQTARFMAESAARLASGTAQGRDAVRRMQDLDRDLRDLFAARDSAASQDRVAEIDARIADRLTQRAEAESEVATAAPAYRQLLQASPAASDVARVLNQREVLVQFLLGPQHGYALAVRPDGQVTASRIELGEAAADMLVRRVRASMEANIAQPEDVPAFDTAGAHALYQRLFAPLGAAMAGADRLVVVPTGPLLALPFGLMLTEPAAPTALHDAAWLLRQFALVHTTSPQALVTVRNGAPASTAARPYIGFGNFQPPTAAQLAASFPSDRCGNDALAASQLRELQGSSLEISTAAALLRAGRGATTLGPDFTLAAVKAARLGENRIIHFATHGLTPTDLSCIDEPSVMVSVGRGAPDASAAFLRASEISTFRLDADLVILSACNTASPATAAAGAAGEALSGLAQSFFWAGARGLLVTHWNVAEVAAVYTMTQMLQLQEEGADSAVALQRAQLDMLQRSGSGPFPSVYAHPRFWAGFALIGDGRRSPAQRMEARATSL
ncbi:CHAT domain-containing protein [Falsiroseomonas sp. HC035]|uniref:CHAT domain-containing protein n=1 Tax=Falsiroseomonas sp. HC035 TaxID=3390999 RepID=UPI003D31957D